MRKGLLILGSLNLRILESILRLPYPTSEPLSFETDLWSVLLTLEPQNLRVSKFAF